LAPATPNTPVHLRLRGARPEAATRLALRAALNAAHLLGLAAGTHLRKLRAAKDPLMQAQARIEEAELRVHLALEVVEMLAGRFSRIPEKRRPHYTPAQRFRILEIRNLLGWNRHQTARLFLVCPNTVSNWERSADPAARTCGPALSPVPPVRRLADSVRHVVRTMARLGFGGQDQIAATLARAGWRLSARSVRRVLKEKASTLPTPLPTVAERPRPVVARFVHHVWMMDVTQVQTFLGLHQFHVAGIYDAFSRAPLALTVFDRRPNAPDMVRLLRRCARAFAPPRYLITDLGGEFIAKIFRRAVSRLGTRQRFASRENLYATARLERFWRTLKQSIALRWAAPLTREDLERRIEVALSHYLLFRPHQGLGGATPAEAFVGCEPACTRALSPPRARAGEMAPKAPFAVVFLDPVTRRFPVLIAP
jgi:transposase InsO family protein